MSFTDEQAKSATTTPTQPKSPTAGGDAGTEANAAAKKEAGDAATASPASPQSDDDRVEKRVREILAQERQKDERSAADRAAHEAWIGSHAPHLAGTDFGKALFAGANTNEQRQARVDSFIAWAKSRGLKTPDMGSSAQREGGTVPDPTADPNRDRVEAANKAVDSIGTSRL